MTQLIYEQPLNEKTRSFLRLEHLAAHIAQVTETDHLHYCFEPIFALAELTERCDFTSDVLKDIDKQVLMLTKWQAFPHVDTQQVAQLIEQLTQTKTALNTTARLGVKLKQDKFISALKHRFCMPGTCCNFDLPQLHFWLALPWQQRQQDINRWTNEFTPLLSAVKLLLKLARETAEFIHCQAEAGFYQATTDKTLSLIRVKMPQGQSCYPTISGHRNRFAIHFVDFHQQKHTDKQVTFSLATCE
ncbi:cell division protein ZapD [Shewanella intestini]|uniref:Cell division protein ZapD n=1 Tax=Shewanella intestini TaxID=2017544 RepID=A0ABS5I6Y2_9GAMM|nr:MULTISPECIES: cell division protein ZapD [Shewanella]MBR9729130.1 cell division protein ZapD [Shewanella intestini]MRG37206.1 cell division protein ZapD [Shewanella sp. XMDDZSB0408]